MKRSNAQPQEVKPFVETFAIDVATGFIGIMELLVRDSREQEMQRKADARARAVQCITDAIFEGRRVSWEEIGSYFSNYGFSKRDYADELGIPLYYLKAALKRWYHF